LGGAIRKQWDAGRSSLYFNLFPIGVRFWALKNARIMQPNIP